MSSGQEQVSRAFGYKWNRDSDFGISGGSEDVMHRWILDMLGWETDADYARFLADKKNILDAGCGNGRDLMLMSRLAPHASITGMDISDAVRAARRNTADMKNIAILQGDVCSPPSDIGRFDYITALGVLHHTPDTCRAFLSMCNLLNPGGEFAFYVYRKKAPIREFTDDMVRAQIRDMSPADAWREMEGITLFGKAVSDLNAQIEVPDIKVLGIEGGKHNLQRLMYYTMIKFYWRDSFTFEENVHVNYDWYYPEFAWRHTRDEVRSWIKDALVEEVFFREIPAGLCFRVRKIG